MNSSNSRNKIKNEIPSITNLTANDAHNSKINEVQNQMPNIAIENEFKKLQTFD